jgi:hypothetical protein
MAFAGFENRSWICRYAEEAAIGAVQSGPGGDAPLTVPHELYPMGFP